MRIILRLFVLNWAVNGQVQLHGVGMVNNGQIPLSYLTHATIVTGKYPKNLGIIHISLV